MIVLPKMSVILKMNVHMRFTKNQRSWASNQKWKSMKIHEIHDRPTKNDRPCASLLKLPSMSVHERPSQNERLWNSMTVHEHPTKNDRPWASFQKSASMSVLLILDFRIQISKYRIFEEEFRNLRNFEISGISNKNFEIKFRNTLFRNKKKSFTSRRNHFVYNCFFAW